MFKMLAKVSGLYYAAFGLMIIALQNIMAHEKIYKKRLHIKVKYIPINITAN